MPFDSTALGKNRPNIIFLMTDDQRWNNLGCYGRPEFDTPHIDRLAEQGVIFDKAYYAVSICMPSRVTMMTGRHFSSHKVGFAHPYNYTLSESDFAASYPAQLKQAGYRTGFIGKLGFAVTPKAQQPNTPKAYDMKKHFGGAFDFFAGQGVHFNVGKLWLWPENDPGLKSIYRKGRSGNERTVKTGDAILYFLDTQPEDRPFCLSVSFYAVKPSNIYPHHREHFKDTTFSVPENWVEGANEKLPLVVKNHARGVRFHPEFSGTPELYQTMMRDFAAQGYSVDQQVARLMDKLKEKGMLENTVIIYTSDNGRYHGSHGMYDKCLLHEDSVRAPLIVWDGRVAAPKRGRREQALVSSVDMAPTILSLAGIKPPEGMQGRDLTTVLNQTQDPSKWRKAALMENLFLEALFRKRDAKNLEELNKQLIRNNQSYRCRGVRTDRWKYFVYYEHNPKIEELYDLDKDPFEQVNLAHQPEFVDTLFELRKQTEQLHSAAAQQVLDSK